MLVMTVMNWVIVTLMMTVGGGPVGHHAVPAFAGHV